MDTQAKREASEAKLEAAGMEGKAEDAATQRESESETEPPVEEVPIPTDAESVDFSHARLRELSAFGFLKAVRRLDLRRNLLTSMEGLEQLPTLEHLDLYDNQITRISALAALRNLRFLDLSYNRLRKLEGLEALAKLEKLYFVHNKIPRIQGLQGLASLQLLELGDNKIRVMEGLETLTRLRCLFLGKNKIRRIQGLEAVTELTVLSVPANRITVLENLPPRLEELYVSENGLSGVGSGLGHLRALRILDLAVNFIERLRGSIAHLTALTDFWFNDNRLADWSELKELEGLPALTTLYLQGNPIQKNADGSVNANYRRRLLLAFPRVTRLDSVPTRALFAQL